MTQSYTLSEGSIERIHNAPGPDDDIFNSSPTVQILSLKKVPTREGTVNTNAPDRYRLIISDGKLFSQAMLATQLTPLVEDNQLGKGSIVKLEKVTCNVVQGKKLVILLQVEVLSSSPIEKIGNPEAVDGAANANISTVDSPASAVATPAAPAPVKTENFAPRQPTSAAPVAGASRTMTSARIVSPIESLSPYQNRWEIRARVASKSDVRHWSNTKGEGRVFNVTFADETGEISATGFNNAVDAFYNKLEKGKVYYVSKARINIAKNKKFSNVNNEYEMALDDRNTIIEECTDASQIPAVRYNFVPLNELEQRNKDDICDVIGIVKDASEATELTSKAGKQFTKRELTLVDQSGFSVRLTLFGKQAEEYVQEANSVVAFKGVRVSEFGGRSLSMLSSGSLDVNPDIQEAFALKGWFDNEGQGKSFQSYSNGAVSTGSVKFDRSRVSNIADVKDAKLGESGQPEFFSCRATVVHIKTDNLAYPACKSEGCSKKVTETGEGWSCEKCNRSWEAPQYRYMVSMSVADHTGQAWLQGFNDVGIVVFGCPADDLIALQKTDETAYLSAISKAAANTYNFTCRAKVDSYNDVTRTRFSITKILPLDYKEEAAALRDALLSDWAK